MSNSNAQTAVSIFFALVAHIAGRGAAILSGIIIARGLGADAFAAFSYVSMTALTFATISLVGMSVVTTRYFSVVNEEITDEQLAHILAIFILGMLASCMVALLIYMAPEVVGVQTVGVNPLILSIAVLGLAFTALINGALTGLERFSLIAAANASSGFIIVTGAYVSAFTGELSIALWSLVVAQSVHLIGFFRVWQHIAERVEIRQCKIKYFPFVKVLQYAGPVCLTTVFSSAGLWLPGRMLLAQQDGVASIAAYAIGLQFFSLVMLFPIVVDRVFQPRIFRYFWQSDISRTAGNPTQLSTLISFGSAGLVGIIIIIYSEEVLQLYGVQPHGAVGALSAFVGMALVVAPLNPIGNAIIAKSAQMLWLKLMMMWFFVVIILSALLVSQGVLGIILGMSFAYIVLLVASVTIGWRMRLFDGVLAKAAK